MAYVARPGSSAWLDRQGLLALAAVQQLDHLLAHPVQVAAQPDQHTAPHRQRKVSDKSTITAGWTMSRNPDRWNPPFIAEIPPSSLGSRPS